MKPGQLLGSEPSFVEAATRGPRSLRSHTVWLRFIRHTLLEPVASALRPLVADVDLYVSRPLLGATRASVFAKTPSGLRRRRLRDHAPYSRATGEAVHMEAAIHAFNA